jgi:glycine cleavage system H protein
MPKPLVFLMGRSPAFVPVDRRYARNHMWAESGPGGWRFGLSAYAVRLLGDVYHLEWSVAAGDSVEQGMPIGYVEASKATSDLVAPIDGRVEGLHGGVLADPSLVNSGPYDAGWLLRIDGQGLGLLWPEEYLAHLEAVWPLAQRLLKGQAGRERPPGSL